MPLLESHKGIQTNVPNYYREQIFQMWKDFKSQNPSFNYVTEKLIFQRTDRPFHHIQCIGPFILQPLFQKSVEKWFQKRGSSNSDFFFWSTTFLQPEKMWIYDIKPPFFWSTLFLEPFFLNQISQPDFLNHFSTLLQKSGCRINGPMHLGLKIFSPA